MHNALSLFCLKYAESLLPERMIFAGSDSNEKSPIAFAIYLIRIGNRNILVDAGCDTMPDFKMRKFYSPSFVIRWADVSVDEITDVIITHSHHDHIEGLKHFKNATVHISDSEYEKGKRYIPESLSVNLFEGEYEIDDGIKIVEVGGHSKGSCVVEIETDGKTVVLAGDECYSNSNIKEKIPTGSYSDKEKSVGFVEKYSDNRYIVLTSHDISLKTQKII